MQDKISVVIIVHDRFINLQRWLECWKQCEQLNAYLTVIHNHDDIEVVNKFKKLCGDNNVGYINRRNIGYDIAAFSEVCKENLIGFDNNWKYLIWIADDTIPMRKTFIKEFINKVEPREIGVSCIEISNEVRRHIRTSGFCIKKEISKRIIFPILKTKQDCYKFEHLDAKNNFYQQIVRLKYKVAQICNLKVAPLWDIDLRSYLNRWDEFNEEFHRKEEKRKEKVTFIVPIYNRFPQIIGSLLNQSYTNWNLLLIHDGPSNPKLKELIDIIGDNRINFIETSERKNLWGHPIRQWAIKNIDELSPNTDYIVVSNDDNTYSTVFIEESLKAFEKNIVATYSGGFIHGALSAQKDGTYKYAMLDTRLQLGYIDCGCCMIKKDVAQQIGWNSMEHSSDFLFFQDIWNRWGKKSFKRINGVHLMHN